MARLCPRCQLPEATECICDDEEETAPGTDGAGTVFGPEAAGAMAGFLRSVMQPGHPPGPPYAHVFRFPAEPEEGEPYKPPPPPFTVERAP